MKNNHKKYYLIFICFALFLFVFQSQKTFNFLDKKWNIHSYSIYDNYLKKFDAFNTLEHSWYRYREEQYRNFNKMVLKKIQHTPAQLISNSNGGKKILLLGDSMMQNVSNAFQRNNQEYEIYAEYKLGTGLVLDRDYDWVDQSAFFYKTYHPDVVFFIFGMNDYTPFKIEGQENDVLTSQWIAEYNHRLDLILKDKGSNIYWLRLPPTKNFFYKDKMSAIRGVQDTYFKQHPNIHYLDIDYSSHQDIYEDDLVHFNYKGSEIVYQEVMNQLNKTNLQ